MNISQYITPLLKWWWLLLASVAIAVVSSLFAVMKQPNVFQAHATLMIGNFIDNPNPNSNEYYVAQQLASSYADIANRELIQSETAKTLGLTYLPTNLTRAIPNTSMIEITVNTTDPKLAQAVANELANQLIKHSPTSIQPEEEQRQKFINDQLDRLQTQMNDTQAEIEKLQQQIGDSTSAREISDIQSQIATQQQKITTLQANYASLLSSTQKGATNSLAIIESAGLPSTPTGPNRPMIVGLAAGIGLLLAALAAYGMELLDDTFKSVEDVSSLIKAPVLGHIGEMPPNNNSVYVLHEPRSPVSDAFRLLRTNLEYLGERNPLHVILVSSPEASDGKSVVAVNLAVSIAQTHGKKVFLIDADLRRPTLHNLLEVQNQCGLSDICLNKTSIEEATICMDKGDLNFIPAGTPPPNPVDLLSSFAMSRTIEEIKAKADIVIIDCPPIFLADTMVLSGKVDGLMLVVSIGHSRKKNVIRLMDQIQKNGAHIIGIVVNRVPLTESYYTGYYHYKN